MTAGSAARDGALQPALRCENNRREKIGSISTFSARSVLKPIAEELERRGYTVVFTAAIASRCESSRT